jgi:hypothetical protein
MFVGFDNLESCLSPSHRSLLTSRQSALFDSQIREIRTKPSWIFDKGSVRMSQQAMQANIDTDLRAGMHNHLWFRKVYLQADVPLAKAPFHDDMLDLSGRGDSSVVLDLDLSDILYVEQGSLSVVKPQTTTVAVGKLNTVPTVASLEAWKADLLLACFDATEESTVRLVKAPQGLLHTGEVQSAKAIRVSASEIPKVLRLRNVGNSSLRFATGCNALLKRRVIHVSRHVKKVT